jgi:energy-coupling factor transport system ATP-binding protein
VREEQALATPGARLFDMAGLWPLPAGVKQARAGLRGRVDENAAGWGRGEQAATVAESREWRLCRDMGDKSAKGSSRRLPGRGRPSLRSHAARVTQALEVRDLWVELDPGDGPRDVLRGIDLEVSRGERVALMGRNGAGKSTLLRCIAGLVDPARGSARAPGDVALLAQSPSDYLVRERVGDELPGAEGRRALEEVGLGWARERDPRDLSGGERQRLALAIVTAGRGAGDAPPGLVCLDEPTRGMDRARKDDLAARIDAHAAAGAAVVVATHDVEFSASFADRVVLLGDGEVIADGGVSEVLSGGWYFATEVARILPGSGAITPQDGARLLAEAREVEAGA